MDARDSRCRTALDILAAEGSKLLESPHMTPELKGHLEAMPSLECLAARQVVRRGVKYRGRVPENIEAFIALH